MIYVSIRLVGEDGSVRLEKLRFWFDNPHLLRQPGQLDAVLRGLVSDWAQGMDEWVTEDVTNHLFRRYFHSDTQLVIIRARIYMHS